MRSLLLIALLWSSVAVAGLRVSVEGHGATQESAKKDGFRKAVEQVVGSVLVSDQEVQGDRLTKDFIGNYSSGFIEDYEINDSYQEVDGQWTVEMSVKVSSSKIAQRMLTRGQSNSSINGEKIADSIASEIEMREKGDALLSTVLDSYPQNAYLIASSESAFQISRLRQPYIDVPYTVSMSKFWLESFNEAVGHVAVESKNCNSFARAVTRGFYVDTKNSDAVKNLAKQACGKDPDLQITYKSPNEYMSRTYSYLLPDQLTLDTINSRLRPERGMQHIAIQVDLYDASGAAVDSRCTNLDNRMFVRWEAPVGAHNLNDERRLSRPVLIGTSSFNGILRLHLDNLSQVQNVSRVKLSVQNSCNTVMTY